VVAFGERELEIHSKSRIYFQRSSTQGHPTLSETGDLHFTLPGVRQEAAATLNGPGHSLTRRGEQKPRKRRRPLRLPRIGNRRIVCPRRRCRQRHSCRHSSCAAGPLASGADTLPGNQVLLSL